MHEQRGFTLLELLVTLSLMALLATLSAPVFSDLAMKTRLDTATDQLHLAIRHTRNAAVARGTPVVIRAKSNGWERGWTIFVDRNADGRYQSGEYRLRTAEPLPTSITVTANAGIGEALHYQADGGTRRPSGSLQMGTLHVCRRAADGAIRASRSIIINASGRPRIERADMSADGTGC
ncbi:GspH/FimT family pseudopilin [Spiribacter vilamensis]|uniref:Type II secretion system protein H n=1 Tax=Spiribacter vilamensis TaxID=531306 RepID=A0A4Q8CY98_9GAMM|nr:GspH/FimT family pseudopilin [Spiribacter vilamensis]RZU97941.1 type IV fimbrial biogenesis protein FimT [Spiribacter vilamensis]TVO61146.1 type II secretion system protein GspH [Spiribacter vilamensis]